MTQQLRPKSLSPRKLTYEEFLEWDGENQHVEWVDGEVIPIAPIGDAHLIGSLEALQCVWPDRAGKFSPTRRATIPKWCHGSRCWIDVFGTRFTNRHTTAIELPSAG